MEVPEIDGLYIYTQAKKIEEIAFMATDAAALMLEQPLETFSVTVKIKLADKVLEQKLEQFANAKAELEGLQKQISTTQLEIIQELKGDMTLNEIGALLGVSKQYVSKVLKNAA